MFYRFLGRLFFYFYVLPFIKSIIWPVIRDMLTKSINEYLRTQREDRLARPDRQDDPVAS